MLAALGLIVPIEFIVPLHAINQLSSNLSRIALHLKHINKIVFFYFVPLVLPGVYLGSLVAKQIDPLFMKLLISAMIIYTVFGPEFKDRSRLPTYSFSFIGFLAGFVGMVVGVMSPVIAPLFIKAGLVKEEMIATKAACQSTTHFLKLMVFSTAVQIDYSEVSHYIFPLIVSSIVGTLISKIYLKKMSENTFKVVVQSILTLIALKFILEYFQLI